jgi:sulfonate transport system permease protein
VAFVFQDYGRALLPWRTVQANVSLALEAAGCPPPSARRASPACWTPWACRRTRSSSRPSCRAACSSACRSRAAWRSEPELMLMDEPFGALDAMTRESLQDELARLVREQGLTVMFVTHDLEEALYLGDRVIALRAHPTPERPSLAAVIDVPLPRPRSSWRPRSTRSSCACGASCTSTSATHEPPPPCPHCPPRPALGCGPAAADQHGLQLRPFVFPAAAGGAGAGGRAPPDAGSDALAPPSAAVQALGALRDGSLWRHRLHAGQRRRWGWHWAAGLGVALGTLLGLSRRAAAPGLPEHRAAAAGAVGGADPAGPAGVRLRPAHGGGVVAFATLWPMLVLSQAAVRQVEPRLLEVAPRWSCRPGSALRWIVLPAMLPRLFVALRLGVAIALVVAVTVEIAANPHGMGYAMMIAQQSLDPALMLAWLGVDRRRRLAINAAALCAAAGRGAPHGRGRRMTALRWLRRRRRWRCWRLCWGCGGWPATRLGQPAFLPTPEAARGQPGRGPAAGASWPPSPAPPWAACCSAGGWPRCWAWRWAR